MVDRDLPSDAGASRKWREPRKLEPEPGVAPAPVSRPDRSQPLAAVSVEPRWARAANTASPAAYAGPASLQMVAVVAPVATAPVPAVDLAEGERRSMREVLRQLAHPDVALPLVAAAIVLVFYLAWAL